MASIQYGNFCYSELLTAIDSDDTSVVVLSGEGARFPATTNGSFYICVWDKYYKTAAEAYQNSCAEIMLCTARSSDTLTVTRAQQSTTARSFNTTGRTYGVDAILTAQDITQPAGVKRYKALLTQTSTNAPVATVIENTLGGTLVWGRTSAGLYTATLSGVFTENKTIFPGFLAPYMPIYAEGETSAELAFIVKLVRTSVNVCTLTALNTGNVYTDALLSSFLIIIEVHE
jgi:hypothetical protein